MTNLYDTIGVERTADASAIRKAYRRAALRAHPDRGGSPEAWQSLSRALAVLTDPVARQRYDETGRVEEPQVDTLEASALQQVMAEIDFVLAQIEARGFFLDDIDVVGDAIRGAQMKLTQIDQSIRQGEVNVEKTRKAAEKFRGVEGRPDRIGPMLRAKAQQFEAPLAAARQNRRIVERAIDILKEHQFGSGKKTITRHESQRFNSYTAV